MEIHAPTEKQTSTVQRTKGDDAITRTKTMLGHQVQTVTMGCTCTCVKECAPLLFPIKPNCNMFTTYPIQTQIIPIPMTLIDVHAHNLLLC